jgi:DNA repair/transcription protein MET18/MMS19
METHNALLGIMALLYNKWCLYVPLPNSDVPRLPVDLIKDIMRNLGAFREDLLERAVDAVIVFTKVANFKGDKDTKDLLYMLIDQLGHGKRGAIVARGFETILSPSEILCKENYVVMRPLYQQRPFAICLPRILELFKLTDDSGMKSNYLVALSGILRWTPSGVVLHDIDSLLPLLLQGLEMPGSDVKTASIDVIETAIGNSAASVEGHLRGIIKRLSDRAHYTRDGPAYWPSAVRIKALKCLSVIPGHLREVIVVPYKFEVLRGLESAVNDSKRSVREEAVRCRSAWFNLAEPTEDDE